MPESNSTSTQISIHAPSRERPDCTRIYSILFYFNPRSLAGATSIFKSIAQAQVFQSTLPRGSDTIVLPIVPADLPLSIHAPSRERHKVYLLMHPTAHFNPRSLAGATLILIRFFVHFVISIHAPSRERLCLSPAARAKMDFNPRSLAGATEYSDGNAAQ